MRMNRRRLRSNQPASVACIATVEQGSPAWEAGLRPGMGLVAVDGQPLRDYIDWLWYTDGDEIELTLDAASHTILCADPGNKAHGGKTTGNSASGNRAKGGIVFSNHASGNRAQRKGASLTLARRPGEAWGIEFDGVVFDGVKTCCNACTFCFMRMLPEGMRLALYVRDDDYRLSFLQGNFVTLTNCTDEDVLRIIEYRLSPLNVSLHAVRPEARAQLMGKHHARGLEVLEQLLEAGIEVRAQIVLVPGLNDDEELDATLAWIRPRRGISSVGIVPYGHTRYTALQSSFSALDAQKVLEKTAILQEEERATTGRTRFMASDEFYRLAYPDDFIQRMPSAQEYDGFPQFEDGIGMLRTFIDDWQRCVESLTKTSVIARPALRATSIVIVTGVAFAPVLQELIDKTALFADSSALHIEVRAIKNRFFGGNVDVAGLLTGQDIIEQLRDVKSSVRNTDGGIPDSADELIPGGADEPIPCSADEPIPCSAEELIPGNADEPIPCSRLVLSDVMLNSNGLFLDDIRPEDLSAALDVRVDVVSCRAEGLVKYLYGILEALRPAQLE